MRNCIMTIFACILMTGAYAQAAHRYEDEYLWLVTAGNFCGTEALARNSLDLPTPESNNANYAIAAKIGFYILLRTAIEVNLSNQWNDKNGEIPELIALTNIPITIASLVVPYNPDNIALYACNVGIDMATSFLVKYINHGYT